MSKDDQRLLRLPCSAPPRHLGLPAEQMAALREIREQMEALQKWTRPFSERLRRIKQESDRLERESALGTRIAHAQRQIDTWQDEKKVAETELADLAAARGTRGRTANPAPVAPPAAAAPANPQPADPPPSAVAADQAANAPRRKPGKPAKYDWPMVVAAELIRRAKAGEKDPTATKMIELCELRTSYSPGVKEMQLLLKKLLLG